MAKIAIPRTDAERRKRRHLRVRKAVNGTPERPRLVVFRSASGDIQSLIGTTRDHVQSFYRGRWRPDRAVLTISGDVTPERAFAVAEEWFGRWSGKTSGDRAVASNANYNGVYALAAYTSYGLVRRPPVSRRVAGDLPHPITR